MQQKILADAMLKNLARWLRIFGLPAIYAGGLRDAGGKQPDDEALLRFALKNKAMLVTRDEALGQKAANYVPTVLLRTMDVDSQLLQVLSKTKTGISLSPTHTLCAHCGGSLSRVPKASVREKVFPKVYAHNRVFWQCKKCGKLYWKGGHWEKIVAKAEKISKKLALLRRK
ncbi:MAG: Mut7-C RNAse domain-containing protein [Candidatus Micrarchaeia archaeon]|jgi:hypothetical protein